MLEREVGGEYLALQVVEAGRRVVAHGRHGLLVDGLIHFLRNYHACAVPDTIMMLLILGELLLLEIKLLLFIVF